MIARICTAILYGIYCVVYTVAMFLCLPSYLIKQKRRGGWGTGLLERFGIYRVPYAREPKGGLYVHAVSVGEVLIALKFIRQWMAERGGTVVLATSTATGHETALQAATRDLRVIYAPWDIPGLPGRCFDRFRPEAIILVEAELWPACARAARVRGIPMAMINARLSERSERRYRAVRPLSRCLFRVLDAVGVQDKVDAGRFEGIGVEPDAIKVTGSIKFDMQNAAKPVPREDFKAILEKVAHGRPIVLAASTHEGEEALIVKAVREVGAYPVLVPRHAERRQALEKELTGLGWQCILRSTGEYPEHPREQACYIVDTTGELKDWTALANVVVIGKSFLAEGGQNPAEAVAAGVPVIVGPHMENFDALVHLLDGVGGVEHADVDTLAAVIRELLDNPLQAHAQASRAQVALQAHSGATKQTVRMIAHMLRLEV